MGKVEDRIYTVTLNLASHRPQGMLIVVAEDIDEVIYNHIKKNIGTLTHKGVVELGATAKDGIRIRMAFNGPESLNIGIKTLRELGQSVVDSGVQGDTKLKPKPRPDLRASLANLILLKDDVVPTTSNMYFFEKRYSNDLVMNSRDKKDLPLKALISGARLVPLGYKAEWKD